MTGVQVIKPNELAKRKAFTIPDKMIEIVNELLVENYRHGSKVIRILQNEIRKRWNDDETWCTKNLDFEPLFEQKGYKVVYDKPSYGESYPASFIFTWE